MRRLKVQLYLYAIAIGAALALPLECRAQSDSSPATDQQIWTCNYVATTPQGALQVTAKFQIFGDELAEIETIPKGLNFSERYKILENTATHLVAAISITKFSDHPPPGIGAVVIIIAKQNGLFQQSGAILG